MTSRAAIARRVDELAEEHSGRAFAEAIQDYSATLDEASQELLIIRGSAVVQRIFEVTQVSERLKFVDA